MNSKQKRNKKKRKKGKKRKQQDIESLGRTNTNAKFMKTNAKKDINPIPRPVINIVPKPHEKKRLYK